MSPGTCELSRSAITQCEAELKPATEILTRVIILWREWEPKFDVVALVQNGRNVSELSL